MGWAIGSLVGFVVVTALVIALARNNTARWERDRRAARAAVQPPDPLSVTARAAALLAHVPDGVRRLPHPHVPHPHLTHLPHPHLPHLPHVHLPSWVVDRLPHGRPAVHLPHLPHLDGRSVRRLVHLPLRRHGRDPGPPARTDADESPAGS
jgi:hypothetical protein